EEAVGKLRASVEEQQAAAEAKRGEIGTALVAGLSAGEQAEVEALVPEIDSLKQQLLACKHTRLEVESRMSQLETVLTENLLRRQDEVQAEVDVVHVASRRSELEGRRAEAAAADNALQELVQEHKRVGSRMEQLMKEIRELKANKDKLKQQEEEWERAVQDEGKALEQLLNQRSVWQHKRDEASKKIRDLGSLPADAFDKYQKQSMRELHRLLHRCNEEVQGFGHVNRKALDQYVNFTEQREEMHRRQLELDRSDEKIKELIGVLDQRKDEALERTFKQVARNFRETFAQLVRSGHGSLVMVRKRKEDEAVDEDEDDEEGGGGGRDGDTDSRLDKYAGVRVKVSFTGQGETQAMRQLSGGQKTVVALALIFAIQQCDPAPFYLFDEIDAALDPQYRAAVGSMIRKQADESGTQFVITTFRPELVKVADRVYGVFHKNRVSTVKVIDQHAALAFIEHDQGGPTDFHVPPTVPFPSAATLPVAFGTAHLALSQRAHVGKGHVVLVLGAGGGVGVAAVQICKLLGATVIAVARGAEKANLLTSMGADLVIDTAQHTHPNAIRDQTTQGSSRGVDVLFDTVGGEQFKQGLRVMRWGGHVLVIGFASGTIPSIPANIALVKNLTIHGVYWGSYMQHDPDVLRASMHQLLAWLARGDISVHVSHSFTFDQVHQAIFTLLKRKAVGKVVLLPPSAAAGDSATAHAGTAGSSGHMSRL
ncbi:unnamed protein product, partial [Closterium sp. Yama58-4]